MRQSHKIPTILGIIVLLAGLAAGIGLTQYSAIFRLRAAPDSAPKDVRITNITDTSFTISWTSEKPTLASISWGTDTSLSNSLPQADPALTDVHYFTLRDLAPSTNYLFKINVSGTPYDNNGIAWQARTGPSLPLSANTQVISGSVRDASGAVASNAVVYINAGGLGPLSAKTSSTGNFVIPLSLARSANNANSAQLTSTTLLQILANGGSKGVSTAQITLGSANPVPPMTLGQTHDFRAVTTGGDSVPQSQLNVPTGTTPPSKITLESSSGTAQAAAVTLESVTEGEIITTTDPEFFGDGPPGTTLTITVESDPQTGNVTVASNGNWAWNPPQNLPLGTHKVTISWRDASGVLRLLTRSFEVSAQEGLAFESSQSAATATPTPTPTPIAVLTPTPAPVGGLETPTATPSATASPRVSIPATDSGTPVAGSISPTLLMLGSGFIFITLSVLFAIKG